MTRPWDIPGPGHAPGRERCPHCNSEDVFRWDNSRGSFYACGNCGRIVDENSAENGAPGASRGVSRAIGE